MSGFDHSSSTAANDDTTGLLCIGLKSGGVAVVANVPPVGLTSGGVAVVANVWPAEAER
jgi:hypothetical protein